MVMLLDAVLVSAAGLDASPETMILTTRSVRCEQVLVYAKQQCPDLASGPDPRGQPCSLVKPTTSVE